jgi:hypothetical protein
MSEVSRGPPNELTPESWTPNFGVLHVQIQRHVQAGGRFVSLRRHAQLPRGWFAFRADYSMVRRWVHAANCVAGLSRKQSHHDAQFRLSVLERMWKDGLSRRQAAALFDIRSVGCLSVRERQYERGGLEALAPRPRGGSRSMPKPPVAPPRLRTPAGMDHQMMKSEAARSCWLNWPICGWRMHT